MSTMTQKSIARKVADATGITFAAAKALVSESITDLGINRIRYNQQLRSWKISSSEADMLIEMLTS